MKFRLDHVDEHHMAAVHEVAKSDLDVVADHCARLRSIGETGSRDMKHVATVPAFVVQQYINDNGITFAEFMRDPKHANRLLSDPALAGFRVWGGKL